MDEAARKARNTSRLIELHPVFRARVAAVIAEMEAAGLRPRLQEAWRSPEAQMAAFRAGTSKLKYGYHNVTAADGTKEALAADIIDDNHVDEPPRAYILHLAAAALRNGVMTGAFFDLDKAHKDALYQALVESRWDAVVSTGWDPCHVQVLGVTVEQAQAGVRPLDPNAPVTPVTPPVVPVIKIKRRYRVTELESNRSEDLELETPLRPAGLLSVPWVSMLGAGADVHSNDSAAACAAMLLRAYLGVTITPDDFYVRYAMPEDTSLSAARLRNALGGLGLLTDLRKGLSLADLFEILRAGKPALVYLRYRALSAAGLTEKKFEAAHSALAVGMDSRSIYLNDPLYVQKAQGEARAYPLELFLQAWKESALDADAPQPERSALVPVGAPGGRLTRRVRVTAQGLNVRARPESGAQAVGTLKQGDLVELRREVSGWGELGVNRWVSLKFVEQVGWD